LNRILCRNRFSRNESALDSEEISMPTSFGSGGSLLRRGDTVERPSLSGSSSGFYNDIRSGLAGDDGQLMDQIFGIDHSSASPCRPRPNSFTPPLGGFSLAPGEGGHITKPAESIGLSPQSDIGYGTSFESNESRGQSLRRDIDIEGLSELLRNISMNTLTMKIPGSPLCSSSSHGGVPFGKSCYGDGFNVLQTSGLTHFDPAVAQAAIQTVHHHHSHPQTQDQAFLRSLDQCLSGGGSGSGLLGEGNRLGSNLNQSFEEHFGSHVASSNIRNSFHDSFSAKGFGCSGSPQQHLDILDQAARNHRSSAAVNSATVSWSGKLPLRGDAFNSQLSCKVFLGGVAWDISEQTLVSQLRTFGNVRVDWPSRGITAAPKGYLYVIFENEAQVRNLLTACTHDYGSGGSWYYRLFSRKSRTEDIQVIPWVIADSSCMRSPSQQIDPKKTVFVGALHGTINAEGLCNIFNELFGGVIFASIDTDKYKYPIGSGRVAFNNMKSYLNAMAAAFIEIRTPKFTKKIQVDPYLEDAVCCSCNMRQGPYFCRDFSCFKYFCHTCWEQNHSAESLRNHKTLMRNPRPHLAPRNRPTELSSGSLGMQNHYD